MKCAFSLAPWLFVERRALTDAMQPVATPLGPAFFDFEHNKDTFTRDQLKGSRLFLFFPHAIRSLTPLLGDVEMIYREIA